MLKYALFSFLLTSAWSQGTPVIPPDPPACLSKPVTLGSVTISCILLDVSHTSGVIAPGFTVPDAYLFQVTAFSTDPDVIGFRFGLTWQVPATAPTPPLEPMTDWGTAARVIAPPSLKLPAFTGYRYTFVIGAGYPVTAIQVQELKPGASQTF